MKVTPEAATSARPFRPLGAFPADGGGFESTIGNTRCPPITSVPVCALIVIALTLPEYRTRVKSLFWGGRPG
jgi:hypothetical protein